MFACFVDLQKAFDTVWRDGVFHKLKKYNIGGNFLRVIMDMYREVNFSIKLQDGVTKSFSTSVGVKQGCVLSPKLFNLYINDLPLIFDDTCDQIDINGTFIYCLMYADDLILISKSRQGLQNAIGKLEV